VTQDFTDRVPFLSPNKECQTTEGNSKHFLTRETTNWSPTFPDPLLDLRGKGIVAFYTSSPVLVVFKIFYFQLPHILLVIPITKQHVFHIT